MATSLQTQLKVEVIANLANVVGLYQSNSIINNAATASLAQGTGANQSDRIYHETNTLGASATKDYDLAGVLTDIYGTVISFARVKAVAIFADAANTNNVVLGGAAATQWVGPFGAAAHTIHVRPGGALLFFCSDATGWPVGAGATDFLRAANSAGGTSVTYSIIVIGASA